MYINKFVVIVFLFYIASFAFSESNFTPRITTQVTAFSRLDVSANTGTVHSGTAIIEPSVYFAAPNLQAELAVQVINDSQSVPELLVSHASFSYLFGAWQYRFGYGGDSIIKPLCPEALFNEPEQEAFKNLYVTIGCTMGHVMFKLTSIPFEPVYPVQDRNASLFQTRTIKDPFAISNFGFNVDYSLSKIIWNYVPNEHQFIFNPATELSAAYEGDKVKARLSLFYGPDPQPAKINQIIVSSVNDSYTLYQDYVFNTIKAFRFDMSYNKTGGVVFANATFIANRLFAYKSIYFTDRGSWQETVPVSLLQYTTGFFKYLGNNITIKGIYTNTLYLYNDDNLQYPFLHRTLVASLNWFVCDRTIESIISYLHSLQDGSFLGTAALSFFINPSVSWTIKIMVPGGSEASELGQYGKRNTIMGAFVCKIKMP